MNSLIPSKFKRFVIDAIKRSDQLYAERRGEEIEVAPEFAKLLIESNSFSNNIYNRKSYRKQRKIQSAFKADMEEYSVI